MKNDTNTKLRIIAALGSMFSLSQGDVKTELTTEKNNEEVED